ncbi:MAG: hypothetical protein U9P90_00805 [Patescibacteria group bacterium]|nr:hypothetical protein [Patescibacteria group bacterium]
MPEEIKKPVHPAAGGDQPVAGGKPATEQKIHVMPGRFLGVEPGDKPIEQTAVTDAVIKKKFPLVPVIIAGVILVVVSGGVIYFFLNRPDEPPIIIKDSPKVVTPPSIGEEDEEPETATSTPEEPEEEGPEIIEIDTDGDGLTDVEERVYGSDITDPDTDGDGHLDGHEVFHLYNPAGGDLSTLLDMGLVKNYTNNQHQYEIYYPSPWSAQILDQVLGTMIFSSGTGEFVEVLIEENQQDLPIISWYLSQAPGVRAGDLETFVAKSGLDGIKSPDRRTAYFTKNGLVYIISYNIGAEKEIYYKRTFEMMLNSFKVLR